MMVQFTLMYSYCTVVIIPIRLRFAFHFVHQFNYSPAVVPSNRNHFPFDFCEKLSQHLFFSFLHKLLATGVFFSSL